MINLQVRMYKDDLSYSHTAALNLSEAQVEALLEMIFAPAMGAPGYKKVWPTNVMIRRNGKLISYKDFKGK